ncbi:hypothetical protein SCP_0212060 [Sparassis crispa]|uniref:Uncharacterized protein n=1 Tax=Sparassis crispa TaxID=139825 RepID=A0A401GCU2_9APHY|nr:hypothetical protein SCP_0212060 [Sparassis crispa]GBE80004.1 hypothetical protein SCP_0212060 [Sparassis crispa]
MLDLAPHEGITVSTDIHTYLRGPRERTRGLKEWVTAMDTLVLVAAMRAQTPTRTFAVK